MYMYSVDSLSHILKSWYTCEGPEQGFWHYFADGLNQRFSFLCGTGYLTIIPQAWTGSESIAHKVEGRMGYWLRGHEGERNNCFSKIQLVGQKYGDKIT